MSERQLKPGRLEAFSDGVIAVIITIMVLELRVPGDAVSNEHALHMLLPLVLVYILSFVQVGIYWVNHHYLIEDVEQVTHGLLWANLGFLFALSLIPFATNWVGARGMNPFSVALYSTCCFLPALTWIIVSSVIVHAGGASHSSGSLPKQIASGLLYLGSIPLAYVSVWLSIAMIFTVAVLWLIPPRRVREQTRRRKSAASRPDAA